MCAGLQLNAVSLVNLAMSLGIAVEFCAHVLHAYCATSPELPRAVRAEAALLARWVTHEPVISLVPVACSGKHVVVQSSAHD